ncbi:hypothetical protein GQ457_01G022720 [Hibiscus cannabinus]
MFDLAINTTLDPQNPRMPHTLRKNKDFRDFCSQVYSGELSRGRDEISVETKDSRTLCHQEIQVVDFSG